MSKSTAKKPSKPYPTFPLYAHSAGYWAKRIRGRIHYFGPWRDPDAALAKYQAQANDLHAGRIPREPKPDCLNIAELCNHFCDTQDQKLEMGIIADSTHKDYIDTCDAIVKFFGRSQAVDDLQVEDFAKLKR